MKKNPIASRIETFLNEFDELEKLNAQVSKEHSDIDKSISGFYHKVEGIEIKHVSQSHNLIKELKALLNRRRDIKIESILLRSTCDTLREKVAQLKNNTKNQLIKDEQVRKEIKDNAIQA